MKRINKMYFSDNLLAKLNKHKVDIYGYVDRHITRKIIKYVVDSNFRQSVSISTWLENSINRTLNLNDLKSKPRSIKNEDAQMMEILRWVKNNIKYVPDSKQWKRIEYWQKPQETLNSMQGDCEDGAILMYCLARMYGIPENRLLLICSDTPIGGHCYLAYKPTNYPLNFTFMDWCYNVDLRTIQTRTKYSIVGKTINGDKYYSNMWFAFNEIDSYSEIVRHKIEDYNGK